MKTTLRTNGLFCGAAALSFTLLLTVPARCQTKPDLLIADFEGETYGDWKTTGDAFGPGPANGTLPNQMQVDGYQGKRLVNSFHNGDRSVGTLSSPAFQIQRRYIQF